MMHLLTAVEAPTEYVFPLYLSVFVCNMKSKVILQTGNQVARGAPLLIGLEPMPH
jgi:hypothetical protein